jgi:hypothetical protein
VAVSDVDADTIYQFFVAAMIGDILLFGLVMMAAAVLFVAFIRQFFK